MTLLEICEDIARIDDTGRELPTIQELCAKYPEMAADIVEMVITYMSAANRDKRRLLYLMCPLDGTLSRPSQRGIAAVKRKMRL